MREERIELSQHVTEHNLFPVRSTLLPGRFLTLPSSPDTTHVTLTTVLGNQTPSP